MSEFKSMALAIEVAERRRDQAERMLMQARRAVQFAQGQLDQLESYAADTQARWSTVATVSVSPALLQHHYQFMERLRQAIVLQSDAIADLNRQTETARQGVVQEEVRLAGLNQALKKRLTIRAQQQARREQKQMDELASLKYASHAGGMRRLLTGDGL